MGAELDVDTAALRHAAEVLGEAARHYRAHQPAQWDPLPDGALGDCPAAREVAAIAQRRAVQCCELADRLAAATEGFADHVRSAADLFDRVDVMLRGGR